MLTSAQFKISNVEAALAKSFSRSLLRWNTKENKRQMPWKGERDPYRIWISEIILQQTRVEQGLKYYQNFIKAFPTISALAKAPDEKVFKQWEGLGYYSRCRNLIETAKFIHKDLNSVFPSDFKTILNLKGIGNYTAAAIASFAYNLPHAVLDGNVYRVLSRIFYKPLPIDSLEGKKYFSSLSQQILPANTAAAYNQAIMDFGATICKPVPDCGNCFFNRNCRAFLKNNQQQLPVKDKKITVTNRWFNYVVLIYKDQLAIQQRLQKDIWQQLYQFVLLESSAALSEKQVLRGIEKKLNISVYTKSHSAEFSQKLSHQTIHFKFITLELNARTAVPGYRWVATKNLHNYAFPKTLQAYLKQILLAFAGK